MGADIERVPVGNEFANPAGLADQAVSQLLPAFAVVCAAQNPVKTGAGIEDCLSLFDSAVERADGAIGAEQFLEARNLGPGDAAIGRAKEEAGTTVGGQGDAPVASAKSEGGNTDIGGQAGRGVAPAYAAVRLR